MIRKWGWFWINKFWNSNLFPDSLTKFCMLTFIEVQGFFMQFSVEICIFFETFWNLYFSCDPLTLFLQFFHVPLTIFFPWSFEQIFVVPWSFDQIKCFFLQRIDESDFLWQPFCQNSWFLMPEFLALNVLNFQKIRKTA